MLQPNVDARAFAAHYDAVQDQGVKDAFIYLIGWGAVSKDYICSAGGHGYIADVRFTLDGNTSTSFKKQQPRIPAYHEKGHLFIPVTARN